MSLFDKIRFRLAKMGLLSLENAGRDLQMDLDFIKICVKKKGASQFAFAGDWIKSDMKSILELVKINYLVLLYCGKTIYDRYSSEPGLMDVEKMDGIVFAIKCCESDELSFSYLSTDLQDKYYDLYKNKEIYKGRYQGKNFVYDFNKTKCNFPWIEFLKEDIN